MSPVKCLLEQSPLSAAQPFSTTSALPSHPRITATTILAAVVGATPLLFPSLLGLLLPESDGGRPGKSPASAVPLFASHHRITNWKLSSLHNCCVVARSQATCAHRHVQVPAPSLPTVHAKAWCKPWGALSRRGRFLELKE